MNKSMMQLMSPGINLASCMLLGLPQLPFPIRDRSQKTASGLHIMKISKINAVCASTENAIVPQISRFTMLMLPNSVR